MRELIHNLLQRLGAGRVPPGVQPTVEWQLCGACNYDCSYCIQSKRSRRGAPSLALLQRILSGLCALPGSWELKVSGGEPFANPHFVELVVPTLVEQSSHCLSVLSNFSAPLSSLQRFSEQSGERLRIFSASFHPEFCTLSEFLDKALRFRALRERNNPQSSFVVNVVLSPQSLAEQAGWKARLEAEGFRYYPQLMKVGGELYPYGAQQRALLASLFPPDASPHEANLAPSYKGQRCHAGRWYFVLDQHGQAYRCRPAKRLSDDDPEYSLGAIGEPSFARRRSWLCPFERCPCSVPANRGIVESRGT
ncbi:MAG: radical SAM protein, partial [Myxococcota bacterium]|nr:radical SAM protein [Myxococcota bacterium]